MKNQTIIIRDEGNHRVEDAQVLLAATAHVAEKRVVEAGKRLAAANENGKETWNNVQEKAIVGVKATDQVIGDHPFQSIAVLQSWRLSQSA